MRCPVCHSNDIQWRKIELPFFRHSDYHLFSEQENSLGVCTECAMVLRGLEANDAESIQAMYRSDSYRQKMHSDHMVFVAEYETAVSPYFLQVEMLRKHISLSAPRILDIGCLDGAFLKEMAGVYPKGSFVGFDISDNTCGAFPQNNHFSYYNDIQNISGTFDLILLSHSIQYIQDLNALKTMLRSLLIPGGKLFIQTPDYGQKPCSLLLGDLFYHFSSASMDDILAFWGFEPIFSGHRWFSKDMVVLARKTQQTRPEKKNITAVFHQSVDYLNQMKNEISILKKEKNIYVLGTTIEAAAADHLLEKRNIGFVDENPKKQGGKFLGKQVCPVDVLKKGDCLVVPYGEWGQGIAQRIEKNTQAVCRVV